MHTVAEVAKAVRRTYGPDDVYAIYKHGTIWALAVADKQYQLDTHDPALDDLLRIVGVPRKLN